MHLAVTLWMGYKVYLQQRAKNGVTGVTASAPTNKKDAKAKKAD
jgi:hypothetical protein